jgi:hypothetical protein
MKIVRCRKLKVVQSMLIRRVRVVPPSTFVLDAGYLDSDSLDFPQNLQTKARIIKPDLKHAASEIILMGDIAFFHKD